MDSNEIKFCLNGLPNFIGCFPRDRLPVYVPKEEYCFIANTDPHDKTGTHWVAVHFKRGAGFYMDPFGVYPFFREFKRWLDTHCYRGWTYNKRQLQCVSCTTCGPYCVLFAKYCLKYYLSHRQFVALFTKNLKANDNIVLCLYKIL